MARINNLFPWKRRQLERDLDRELRYHIDRRVDDLVRSGSSEADARKQAALELGGVTQLREEVRDTWSWRVIDELWRDVRHGTRSLQKAPAFAFTAIVTIALGIGASATIFSVVDAVLLRPLPFTDQQRLAFIQNDLMARKSFDLPIPPGDLPDLRQSGTLFDEIAALTTARQTYVDDAGQSQLIDVANVTTNFFRTLGVHVVRGRDFSDADGLAPPPPPQFAPGAPPLPPAQLAALQVSLPPPPPVMAILSDGLWRRQFGADPNVAGKTFRIGRFATAEIVGVLEPGVELLWPAASSVLRKPELYTAMRADFASMPRNSMSLRTFGRIKPGVAFAQAQSQIDGIVSDLRKRFAYKETAGIRLRVEPMQAYLVAGVRPAILALMGAVGFVLLIACANVANLLLVRAGRRERELAVRAALGGNRWSLVRQMFVESMLLAATGAVLGLALAWGGVRLLLAVAPANLPRIDHVAINPLVLVFAIVAAVVSAVLFGTVPALRASRVDVSDILRKAGRNAGLAGGKWLRNGVVIAEVSLAFVLLVGAGLMIRSFVTLQHAQPGFEPNGLLTFFLAGQGRQTFGERSVLMQDIQRQLGAIPGATAVSAASQLPLESARASIPYGTAAAVADPALFQQADLRIVLPDYFTVMGTPLIEGRLFTAADNDTGIRRLIIDDVLARKTFPGESAVGKRLFLRSVNGLTPDWWEIVGVVRQQRNTSLAVDGPEAVYVTDGEWGFSSANRWVVRTTGDPTRLGAAVRDAMKTIDPTLAIADLRPMMVLVDQARASTRFAMTCIAVFALIAAALASVGLYGVLSTTVRQRTSEIGVRMAFGAQAEGIFGMLLRQGAMLSGIGICIGLAAALALTRLMRTMVVGVGTTDPVTYASIALLFMVVALLACWLPARRAAALDPLVALREE